MLPATIYNFETELSDVDRGVYKTFSLRMARHPSETLEFMLTRFLAYCLEYTEGITLTDGVSAGDKPAVLVRDLTGRVTAWIEVGMPDAKKLHRGSKLARRAAVYTHRTVGKVLRSSGAGMFTRRQRFPSTSSATDSLTGRLNTAAAGANHAVGHRAPAVSRRQRTTFPAEITEHRFS